jgi:histidine triad (HIT) family protein
VSPVAEDCIFCKIVARQIPADVVLEDDDVVAFKDIHPQAPVHVLIIPKKHIATVNDIPEAEAVLVGRMVLAAQRIARDNGIAENGYRLVMNCNHGGGQSVFHIHMHMLGGKQMRMGLG